jgi:hypothetical protein
LLKASGYKWNCVDSETQARLWISGPRRDGADRLHGGLVEIDEDARVEYWTEIRERPDMVGQVCYRAGVSTRTSPTTRGSTFPHAARRPR